VFVLYAGGGLADGRTFPSSGSNSASAGSPGIRQGIKSCGITAKSVMVLGKYLLLRCVLGLVTIDGGMSYIDSVLYVLRAVVMASQNRRAGQMR